MFDRRMVHVGLWCWKGRVNYAANIRKRNLLSILLLLAENCWDTETEMRKRRMEESWGGFFVARSVVIQEEGQLYVDTKFGPGEGCRLLAVWKHVTRLVLIIIVWPRKRDDLREDWLRELWGANLVKVAVGEEILRLPTHNLSSFLPFLATSGFNVTCDIERTKPGKHSL